MPSLLRGFSAPVKLERLGMLVVPLLKVSVPWSVQSNKTTPETDNKRLCTVLVQAVGWGDLRSDSEKDASLARPFLVLGKRKFMFAHPGMRCTASAFQCTFHMTCRSGKAAANVTNAMSRK